MTIIVPKIWSEVHVAHLLMLISAVKKIGHFVVPAYGKHNVLNALSVVAVCHNLGLDMTEVADHLLTFRGVKRRFTEKK